MPHLDSGSALLMQLRSKCHECLVVRTPEPRRRHPSKLCADEHVAQALNQARPGERVRRKKMPLVGIGELFLDRATLPGVRLAIHVGLQVLVLIVVLLMLAQRCLESFEGAFEQDLKPVQAGRVATLV